MRIFSINWGVKGSRTLQEYAIRFAYMISEEAKKRPKILTFWQTHGLAATKDAHDVQRRTLFGWKRKLKEGRGKLESLNPGSRRPNVVRKRLWDAAVIEEIKRLRFDYPNIGKEKLHPLLLTFCEEKRVVCPKIRNSRL